MIEVRCLNCNKLLMKADLVIAAVKCPGCKMIFEYKLMSNAHTLQSDEHDIIVSEPAEADSKEPPLTQIAR